VSSYRPISLANTLYKLLTHLITKHQLQNVIMALEDAKLFRNDIYALIVDFTSAFNTTDHDRMFWIMYHV